MAKRLRFTSNSRRHKIGKGRALSVIKNYEAVLAPGNDGEEVKWYWQGVDDRGLELEIIGIEMPDQILIIHVMPFNFRRRRKDGQ